MTVVTLRPEQLIEELPALGSPPLVYRRLVEVLEDPSCGMKEAAEVIQQDPALTVRILRIANSAFFSFPRDIDSVLDAVNVIGTTHVRDLALATSVTALFRDVPPELVNGEAFWRHSLACGVGARVLASARGSRDVERYFVTGMLHDIGRLVLFLGAPHEAGQMIEHARSHDVLLHQAENDLAGFDHATVGWLLMERWEMAGSLAEAIRYHHRPTLAEEYPVETAGVHIADVFANAMELGTSGEMLIPGLSPEAWETFGLPAAAVPSLAREIERRYEESLEIFGLGAD